MSSNRNFLNLTLICFLFLGAVGWQNEIRAGELELTWTDNSNNEDGFKIERKSGTAGTYAQIATAEANVSSYTELGLINSATYSYRLSAFNSAGSSPYSSENCAPAGRTVQNFATKSVIDGGTITTAAVGINCGTIYSGLYNSGTIVTLTATPVTPSRVEVEMSIAAMAELP
jgi:hypothetical protein